LCRHVMMNDFFVPSFSQVLILRIMQRLGNVKGDKLVSGGVVLLLNNNPDNGSCFF
jgi:hypothetical protein